MDNWKIVNGEEYSWSKQCKSLIEKMFKLVDGMNYI